MAIDNNKIKHIVGKAFLFVIIVFLLDWTAGYVLRKLYFSQESGRLYRTTYALESTNQDIIILGSSSANHHYIPDIIEDSLGMSCYNAGRDGNGLLYTLAIQKAILLRYKPKLFLIDLRHILLVEELNEIDKLANLLPYYQNHPEIRSIIRKKSNFENLKMLSKIYPFNSNLITILLGNLQINKTRKKDFKGYVPLSGLLSLNSVQDTLGGERFNYSNERVEVLSEIISMAITANVKIMIISSPGFDYFADPVYDSIIQNVIIQQSVEYWDYLNDTTIANHAKYFQDKGHMNDLGATIFTQEIARRLKKEL